MNADTIPDFLAEQRDAAPEELQPLILDFENYWERKLWHQLTDALVQFFNDDGSAPQRLPFYRVFILKFADKINKLKLVDLALKAASQCKGINIQNGTCVKLSLTMCETTESALSFCSPL